MVKLEWEIISDNDELIFAGECCKTYRARVVRGWLVAFGYGQQGDAQYEREGLGLGGLTFVPDPDGKWKNKGKSLFNLDRVRETLARTDNKNGMGMP